MKEFVSDAIVLDRRPSGESDLLVDLFTKDLGRIKAKVTSGRKILSKLSSSLDSLNFVEMRIIEKKNFTVADAVIKQQFPHLKESELALSAAFRGAYLLRKLLPFGSPDLFLWHEFLSMLRNSIVDASALLRILGYGSSQEGCAYCKENNAARFHLRDQVFLCVSCSVRFPRNILSLE